MLRRSASSSTTRIVLRSDPVEVPPAPCGHDDGIVSPCSRRDAMSPVRSILIMPLPRRSRGGMPAPGRTSRAAGQRSPRIGTGHSQIANSVVPGSFESRRRRGHGTSLRCRASPVCRSASPPIKPGTTRADRRLVPPRSGMLGLVHRLGPRPSFLHERRAWALSCSPLTSGRSSRFRSQTSATTSRSLSSAARAPRPDGRGALHSPMGQRYSRVADAHS